MDNRLEHLDEEHQGKHQPGIAQVHQQSEPRHPVPDVELKVNVRVEYEALKGNRNPDDHKCEQQGDGAAVKQECRLGMFF